MPCTPRNGSCPTGRKNLRKTSPSTHVARSCGATPSEKLGKRLRRNGPVGGAMRAGKPPSQFFGKMQGEGVNEAGGRRPEVREERRGGDKAKGRWQFHHEFYEFEADFDRRMQVERGCDGRLALSALLCFLCCLLFQSARVRETETCLSSRNTNPFPRLHKQPSMCRPFAASRFTNLSCRTEAMSVGVVFRKQTVGESITRSSRALGYNPR